MNSRDIAKDIIRQWEQHDVHRAMPEDALLYSNGKEPDSVAVARALLDALQRIEAIRVIMLAVLEGDALSGGLAPIAYDLREQIRNAIYLRREE